MKVIRKRFLIILLLLIILGGIIGQMSKTERSWPAIGQELIWNFIAVLAAVLINTIITKIRKKDYTALDSAGWIMVCINIKFLFVEKPEVTIYSIILLILGGSILFYSYLPLKKRS
ncbi:MAG TPA: hypothetical protein VKO43_00905 [Candidatus Krumholzibacteriaceae bacterium]|nr:hypothetical protein [Candidatus Krumholzibacteriaceae bacterium]